MDEHASRSKWLFWFVLAATVVSVLFGGYIIWRQWDTSDRVTANERRLDSLEQAVAALSVAIDEARANDQVIPTPEQILEAAGVEPGELLPRPGPPGERGERGPPAQKAQPDRPERRVILDQWMSFVAAGECPRIHDWNRKVVDTVLINDLVMCSVPSFKDDRPLQKEGA